MIQTDSFSGGIHQLLYGQLRPGEVLDRYENSDNQLCHTFYEVPASPALYMESDEQILNRWQSGLDQQRKENWIASWYRLPDSEPESYHILCEFYRSYIYCECRMMIQSIESRIEDSSFDVELLKYEIAVIQGEAIELLRECGKRIRESSESSTTDVGQLTSYLLELLKNNMMMILLELQERYSHLLEGRTISEKELHLKYLKQPVPGRNLFYGTAERIKAELELASRPPEILRNIEELLYQHKKTLRQQTPESARDELITSLHILENAWLCAYLSTNDNSEIEIDVAKPVENAVHINRWITSLNSDNEPDHEAKKIIEALLHRIPKIRAVFPADTAGDPSEAVQLINRLETLFSRPEDSERSEVNLPQPSKAIQDEEHWLFKFYISFEQIRKKFKITDKTLKKYLSESQTPVIEITAKNRWIHVNDFKAFMKSHRKTYTS